MSSGTPTVFGSKVWSLLRKNGEGRTVGVVRLQVRSCSSSPNLRTVLGATAPPNGEMRLVVTDRFYSAVAISKQLLTMGLYSIGTVRTDRLGLSSKLLPKKKKGDKKKNLQKYQRTDHPSSNAEPSYLPMQPKFQTCEFYGGGTHMLFICSVRVEVLNWIVLRDKLSGEQQEVVCPRNVKAYQTYMVVWTCTTSFDFKGKFYYLVFVDDLHQVQKLYKSMFLGLVDLAVINAYIVHNAGRHAANLPKVEHVIVLKQLHLELCQLCDEDRGTLKNNRCFQATPSKAETSIRT
ncbi:LOW QUALITY PROTEIN: hypothetical protein PHMEG_0001580 [Phytophthora megakarya]|uniref:PiggyBac transposable element-derived protein domain-containing protein n=1 Tax=Phytophthora megakarya TaxID=4795 RepID=A0A225X069_9STRA|nr:LOW QUALITY PROTEIN: hypothetical protein PHMEG_0001580 [Phytophthora megakarya]